MKEPQGKMALRKIRKFPQNDEVASKVLSGPGPINQNQKVLLSQSSDDQWLLGPHVQTSGPPRIIQSGTLEHRYKKLHQSNELDCSVTHKLFSSISKHYSFSLF